MLFSYDDRFSASFDVLHFFPEMVYGVCLRHVSVSPRGSLCFVHVDSSSRTTQLSHDRSSHVSVFTM